MDWRRPSDKPLSELMMVSLRMHICVTRPQQVMHMVCVVFALITAGLTNTSKATLREWVKKYLIK